jgi:hypothetical protein
LSYGKLLNENADASVWYFILEILLTLVNWYLSDKNSVPDDKVNYRYTSVIYDEAHRVMNKWKTLDDRFTDFVREIRNKRSNIILASQSYNDFPSIIHDNTTFCLLLDKINYTLFEKSMIDINLEDNELWKIQKVIKNFREPLSLILEQSHKDLSEVEAWKKSAKDALRFCIFVNKKLWSMFILNTKL